MEEGRHETADMCSLCGWWRVSRHGHGYKLHGTYHFSYQDAAVAVLKQLDLNDVHVPIAEVKSYLIAQFDARFKVHPRVMEETVASVFRGVGYSSVIVTNYSGDDGIDIFMQGSDGIVGVQVKRYRNKIEAEQIRSLTGALVLSGVTRGVFVTTSSFTAGATDTAARYGAQGFSIELVDANRLYDALKLNSVQQCRSKHDFREMLQSVKLSPIYHTTSRG
jgi:restriction system protein